MLQYQGGKNLTLRHYGLGAELDRWLARERPRRIFDVTMGGGSVVEHFARFKGAAVFASDLHPAGPCLLAALASGWTPPLELSEPEWQAHKAAGRVPSPGCPGCAAMLDTPHTCPASQDPIHGFAGFGVSYGGMYYQGYGGKSRPKWRDPVGGMARACAKAGPHLAGVTFHTAHYSRMVGPLGRYTPATGDLVYADIPYAGTLDYKGLPPFDHVAFWTWAAQVAATGARVLVSEFTAPAPWRRAWSVEKAKPLANGRAGASADFVRDSLFTLDV